MEDDPGMASPSNLSSRGAGSQMSPSNSETSESRCKFTDRFYLSNCLLLFCYGFVFCFLFTNSSQFRIVLENCKVIFGKF